jgi:very-short-patch-repair endonuclease
MQSLRSTPPDRAVASVALRQRGVVSLGQLRELGLTTAAVKHRLAIGRLHRVHRGVYAVGHAALGARAHRLAAVLACGPGAMLSHRSAAAHWDLLGGEPTRVEVTAPSTRRGVAQVHLHRSRSLGARDATSHEGIPVTTIARTLLDLAATTSSERLERALAQAERLRIYDHHAVADVIARSNGHRGCGRLAAATTHEPRWTRSDLEARFLRLVRDAGLPEPLVNHPLAALGDAPIEVDFHWPSHRLVVETDGWEFRRTRASFERDRRRDAALIASGHTVMRFTWREIRDRPDVVAARLRALVR